MTDGDSRLKAAMLRQAIRDVDSQMQAIQAEGRLFRRFKFDLEVQQIQLTALRDQRAALVGQLDETRSSARLQSGRSGGLRSWLVLPFALGALAIQAVWPHRRRARPRYHAVPNLALTPVSEGGLRS